jgi:cytochrome b
LLLACVVGSLVSVNLGGNAVGWHFRFGYAILTLLLFRLLWGFVGPRYARFASFPPSPAAAIAWMRGARAAWPGHNPVGAFSVYAMLAALALQAVTGLFATDDIMWDGPLKAQVSNATSALLTRVHKVNRFVVLALIALHLVAIAWYGSVRKEPLVRAMIDGDKAVATVAGEPSPEPAADGARERVLALALLGLSAVAVWAIVKRLA